MDLISVIVPVYNIDRYLPKCLESLLNQSYRHIEIILINDGSLDRSGYICDEFCKKDNRIVVIHKNNEGVSSARNDGLKRANGDFVVFVDGDDTLEINALELMINNIKDMHSDMCICDSYYKDRYIYSNGEIFRENDILKKEQVVPLHLQFSFLASLCFCMFKKDLLNNLWLNTSIHTLEDWEFLLRVIDRTNTISVCHKALYHYATNEGSASKSSINDKKISSLNIAPIVKRYIDENNPKLSDYTLDLETRIVLHLLVTASNSKKTEEKYNLLFRKIIRKNLKQSVKSKYLLKRQKLYVLMVIFSPKVYYFFYKLKHRRKK